MKKDRDWAQLGCLSLLLGWALLGVVLQLSGAWSNEAPGDDEGGGPFAVIGILGFIAFVVISGIRGILRGLVGRPRREAQGFPVVPRSTGETKEEVK